MPTGPGLRTTVKGFLQRARNCCRVSREDIRGKEQKQAGGSQMEVWPGANLVNCLNYILPAQTKAVSGRISIIVFSALGYWSGSSFVILMGKTVKGDVSDTTVGTAGKACGCPPSIDACSFSDCQLGHRPVKYCWLRFVVKVKPKTVS